MIRHCNRYKKLKPISQDCELYYYISGADNSLTQLNPVELIDEGQKEFGQYIIKQWEIKSDLNPYTHKRVVKVTMVLSRNFLREVAKMNFNVWALLFRP